MPWKSSCEIELEFIILSTVLNDFINMNEDN